MLNLRGTATQGLSAVWLPKWPMVRAGINPPLLLDSDYSVRKMFNAACHLAGIEPNILFEGRKLCSRSPRRVRCSDHSLDPANGSLQA